MADTCWNCENWERNEPRKGKLNNDGFCGVFLKVTDRHHGDKCTAHTGLAPCAYCDSKRTIETDNNGPRED